MSETLLADLPQTICNHIEPLLPDLKKCEPIEGKFNLEELKKQSLPREAVLVSNLGAKEGQDYSGPAHSFDFQMAAYVVTKDGLGKPRDIRAATIFQILLQLIPGKDWGEEAYGAARNVRLQPLVSVKAKSSGVSLWAVTWLQPVSLFEPEAAPLGVELYVAQAPEIGAAHEADYEQIGGAN